MIRWLLLLCSCTLWSADIAVNLAWSRSTVAGQEAGGVFATIANQGTQPDRLLSVACAASSVVEIHEHAQGADGVMQMRAVPGGLAVPAGGTLQLRPGSYHIMLIGLRAPLLKGAKLAVTLRFERAGEVAVDAEILDPWSMAFDDR